MCLSTHKPVQWNGSVSRTGYERQTYAATKGRVIQKKVNNTEFTMLVHLNLANNICLFHKDFQIQAVAPGESILVSNLQWVKLIHVFGMIWALVYWYRSDQYWLAGGFWLVYEWLVCVTGSEEQHSEICSPSGGRGPRAHTNTPSTWFRNLPAGERVCEGRDGYHGEHVFFFIFFSWTF